MAIYRQLDRSRNEIRLLKILPPESPSIGPLDFSPDVIHCELQYESLDDIYDSICKKNNMYNFLLDNLTQDLPGIDTGDPEVDPRALIDTMRREILKVWEVDDESRYEIGAERKEALRSLYQTSVETMKEWLPASPNVRHSRFETWLDSWIWTPLSGDENHLENQSLGYFALSYTWMDHQKNTLYADGRYKELDQMVTASGSTPRQLLKSLGHTSTFLEETFGGKEGIFADTAEIILNGEPLVVLKNLEMALRTLREIPEVQNGTRIWVDMLCINQNDIAEKSIEVKRMGEIYRKSERVLSWIGEEENQSGQAMEFMHTLGEAAISETAAAPISLGLYQQFHPDAALYITLLLQRSYWSRIWICQEISMGSDRSIIICGARRFSTSFLLRCSKLLSAGLGATVVNLRLKLEQSHGHLTLGDLKSGITKLITLHDAKIDSVDPDRDVPLSNTLWFRIPSSSNATDSRDLIYGMMSLLPQKMASLINVDYSSSTEFVDVMTEFAIAHIKTTDSLHWILHRPFMPFLHFEKWPSWVPNLALPFSSAHWDWTVLHGSDACPGTHAIVGFSNDRATGKHFLTCSGFRIDIINQSTRNVTMEQINMTTKALQAQGSYLWDNPSQEAFDRLEYIQDTLMTLRGSLIPDIEKPEDMTDLPPSMSQHKYSDLTGLKTALSTCFRCLGITFQSEHYTIFDIPFDIDDRGVSSEQEIRPSIIVTPPAFMFINQMREVFADLYLWGQTFKDLFPPTLSGVDPDSFSAPVIRDRTMSFARLFTTCGGYVGTCICNVRPGDEVFLLHGCSMPVVLRHNPDHPGAYTLQGGVYIPGVMEGEALAQFRLLGGIDSVVTIC